MGERDGRGWDGGGGRKIGERDVDWHRCEVEGKKRCWFTSL